MKILSINLGLPREVEWEGKKVLTGIFKYPQPVDASVRLHKLSFEGDGQADLRYHGGESRAVYGYGADSFDWWQRRLGRLPQPGEFGENLTLSELDESNLCIGDVMTSGEVSLQVAEPRFPCFKLGIRFNDQTILKAFMESRRCGIYFRVLHGGLLKVGDTFSVSERDPEKVPMLDLFRVKIPSELNRATLQRALKIRSLSSEWRDRIEKVLSSGS